jgi:hypothetical protein
VSCVWAGRDRDISHRDYRLMHAYLFWQKKVPSLPRSSTVHKAQAATATDYEYGHHHLTVTFVLTAERRLLFLVRTTVLPFPYSRPRPGADVDLSDIAHSFCPLVHPSLPSCLPSLVRPASMTAKSRHHLILLQSLAGSCSSDSH